MNQFGLTFHHFGLAVRTPDDAFIYLGALGYTIGPPVYDPLQGVNLAMCQHIRMPGVEVIWPADSPSPIDRLVKPGQGMIYHLCYTSDEPERSVAAIEEAGLNVIPIGEPKPAVLFGGRAVSFYSIANLGTIEIIHGREPLG